MLFIFDMGGVVTTTAGNKLYEDISLKTGIEAEKIVSFGKGKLTGTDYFHLMDIGKLDAVEFWEKFSEYFHIEVNCDWFRLLFHPEIKTETVELIKKLKAAGHRVVCGTNTINSHYDNHLARGDYSVFDTTYASIHMGVAKPDPEFFQLILACENAKPEDCFFTDDKTENIEAAVKTGIHGIKFENALILEKQIKNLI